MEEVWVKVQCDKCSTWNVPEKVLTKDCKNCAGTGMVAVWMSLSDFKYLLNGNGEQED